MPFETGTFSSPVDLLGKVATFAENECGWDVNSGGTGGDSPGQYSMNSDEDGLWVHAIAENSNTRIRSMPASGYTGSGTNFFAHTGSANNTSTVAQHVILSPISGAGVSYYLFGNDAAPRYITVVAETSAGVFLHWWFGTLRKFGTYTGGGYDTAQFYGNSASDNVHTLPGAQSSGSGTANSSSKHYLRADGLLGKSSPFWTQQPWRNCQGILSGVGDVTRTLVAGGAQQLTGRSLLAPVYAALKNNEGDSMNSSRLIYLGEVQNTRVISMDGRNAAGEVLTIGGDSWYVFPARSKPSSPSTGESALSVVNNANHSNNMGFAYKRVD